MKKKNLFTNLKDYNNELEEILEKKDFSEKVKNLLLSMLYKIETSYSDYKKTKILVPEKWELIEEIINDISLNCNKIEILNPKTKEEIKKINPIIEKNKKEIKTYQNEKQILKAIYEISAKEITIDKKYDIAKIPIKNFFEKLNIENKIEIIRDFDGWTWFREKSQIEDFEYNLIYQNLLILLGNKELENIINNKNEDIIIKINEKLKQYYGSDLGLKIIYYIILIITQKYYKESNLELIESGKLQNKKRQAVEKDISKNKLSTKEKQELKKIDKILSNKLLLEKEFIKRNENGEEIFSLKALVNILNNEKQKILNQFEENINNKKISEENQDGKIQFLNDIKNTNIEKNIINLQKIFIQCLNLKLKKINTKKEIIDLIYITRYYKLLEINNKKNISQIQELNISLNSYISKLAIKSIELKAINKISEYIEINLKIFNEILNLKIIDLENIECIIEKQNNKFIIKLFDDESIEYEKEINEIKIENIKLNKKIKLFN